MARYAGTKARSAAVPPWRRITSHGLRAFRYAAQGVRPLAKPRSPSCWTRARGSTTAPYPRSRAAERPYAVSGIMGCALLVTRPCFEAVGGFSDEIAVYYEDVDFCLAARERGFGAVVEPRSPSCWTTARGSTTAP